MIGFDNVSSERRGDMKRILTVTALVGCGLLVGSASEGQAAEKIKPYPHYWMSVSTSNQSIPGMTAEMSGMAGMFGGRGAFGPRRELLLQVESPRPASGPPRADHEIPPGQNMGASLPLVTPKSEKSEYVPHERQRPEKIEKPKVRMLIYWGCGETIGKGQPRVLDTSRMSPEDFGKSFAGRTPTHQTPPSARKGWVYGEWPNSEDRTEVPKDSSLVGAHLVKGNYLPEIRFSLDNKRDFMNPVEFSSIQATPAGATAVEWTSIPTAIGYFATAMAQDQKTGDSIFWSSSEIPETGFALQDYLTPGDVSRFIKEKVVMDPSRTSCTVPPIFKDAQAAMLQFIAYGEELNLAYPPKPKDPKQRWEPQWSAKVRLKSTGMTPLMAGDEDTEKKSRPSQKKRQQSKPVDEDSSDSRREDGSDSGADRSKSGIGDKLKGLFGF
jgi:hypothetical protein